MEALPSSAIPALHNATLFFRIYCCVQIYKLHDQSLDASFPSVPSCAPLTLSLQYRRTTWLSQLCHRSGSLHEERQVVSDHCSKASSRKIRTMGQEGDGEKEKEIKQQLQA